MLFFLAACATPTSISVTPTPPITAPTEPSEVETSEAAETLPLETALPNCLGEAVSPIGQAIAADYETTSYEQVMTWFCSGAEFEDILVALETEAQTDQPAEALLEMLAGGLTWDEIWQKLGLTD